MPGLTSTLQNCWATKREQYEKVNDTLDVWFDSGVYPRLCTAAA